MRYPPREDTPEERFTELNGDRNVCGWELDE
jgi:hypothetical protein